MIIERPHDLKLIPEEGWILIYGRRKTGKTFLARNWLKPERYFFVGRDGHIYEGEEKLSYQAFVHIMRDLLRKETRVAVDEFHRLPEEFLDFLHMISPDRKGTLILLTSTLWLAQKILGPGSPILGLFFTKKVGLIDERDIILGLSKHLKGRKLIEASVYLREPWLIPYFRKNKHITELVAETINLVPGLLGEIFREEERRLRKSYYSILKAVSDGMCSTKEIKNYMLSSGIIKDDPSLVHPYLNILVKIGLLEKIPLYSSNKFMYRHVSPVFDTYFYLDSKYLISEREADKEAIIKGIRQKLPLHVEQFFERLLAKIFGLYRTKLVRPDLEIDILLLDFRKPKLVAEVKWVNSLGKKELAETEEKLLRFKEARKLLVVPGEDVLPRDVDPSIEVLTPEKVVKLVMQKLQYNS